MSTVAKIPRHLWIIGIITLLWNLMGAFDYLMTETRNEAYMGHYTPEQLDYYYGFPTWLVVFWAIAVWGSVAGSVLLLLRKAVAVPVFRVSFVAMVVTSIYNFGFSNGMEMMGATGAAFSAVIFVVALGLVFYSRAMQVRGVLT